MTAVPAVSKTMMYMYGHVQVQVKTGTFENETPHCLLVFLDKQGLHQLSYKNKLLELAGDEVKEKWMDHKRRGQFNRNAILVTAGGKLKCSKIIHVPCDINTIEDAARDGLMRAAKSKMKTIVIPLLHDDTLMRDVKICHKAILNVIKDFATKLKDVQSVTLVIEEDKKGDNSSVSREKVVDPPRTAPTEQVGQHISPDEPGRELTTHLQLMTGPEVSSAKYNIQLPQTDKWKCCVIVSGDIKSKKDLEEMLFSYSQRYLIKLKHVVYPYEEKSALVIFEKEVDVEGLEHCTKPFKVEPLQPQELDFHVPDPLVVRAYSTGETKTLFTNLKEISGVEVSMNGNSMYLVGVTTHQMDIAKRYLESFRKKWHNSNNKKQCECMLSGTPDEESYSHRSTLNNVSELEFKALEIIENGFEREKGVHISWSGDAVVIYGPPTLAYYAKKNLISQLGALRNKQSEEVFLDEEENKIVQDVIGEVQSKDTVCVYDEKKSQVVVYSDKQDDIMKFKHKLKFRTGKVKESGRNRQRFAENAQSLEACQGNFSSLRKSTEIPQKFSCSNNASDLEVFYTKENIKVSVYKANILNLPVDCIVNAANDNLQHGGGVARVIADAAGPELVRQGSATIMDKVKGKIPVGSQVTTTAGRLPYKCVIHTVGPCWSDYHPHDLQKVKQCEKDLYAAIYGCFVEAEKNGYSSIALPAVSSGIHAVPQDVCAVQYARAVLDYSRNSVLGQSLTEIHFIDKIPHLVKLMQDTFRTMIKNGKVPNYNIQEYVASLSNYQRQQSRETGQKGHEKQDITANNSQYETTKLKEFSPVYYEPIVHHTKQFVFHVSAKPVVCIYEGDILKLKNMDAIVCPNDTKGFGKGSIALELEKKTKYKEQKEKCFESKNPDLGDVVIIHGKENPFDVIVHVVIENNSPQKPEFKSTIKKSIDNILRKTNERIKVKTIALPLFGVKRELLTEKSWAELFLKRFVAFCCEVENPSLEEVHIITHFSSSSAYSTVKKVFTDFADGVNKTHLQEKVPPPRPPPSRVYRTSDHKQTDMGINMRYLLENNEDKSSFNLMKDSSSKEGVKRIEKHAVSPAMSQNKLPLPSHWTPMKVTETTGIQVPLDPKDTEAAIREEFSLVKGDFDKTMSHAEIVSIKRVQNALLWEHYILHKKEMEIKAGGAGLANEMHLYHGTKPDAVDLICNSNFDFRMAGEHVGTRWGQGAYFASEARYSDSYAVKDDKNNKFIFVAKVLVGTTCLGNQDYKKPPYLDDNDKKKGTYNTCVNNVSHPTIFCVFDKNQYYPEYLVEYKL